MKLSGNPKEGGLRVEWKGRDIRELDEIVIGDWLHLERMSGVNSRVWCLILRDGELNQLNLTIVEKDGSVRRAFILEDEGWSR